jgi:ribosome modulation factor
MRGSEVNNPESRAGRGRDVSDFGEAVAIYMDGVTAARAGMAREDCPWRRCARRQSVWEMGWLHGHAVATAAQQDTEIRVVED